MIKYANFATMKAKGSVNGFFVSPSRDNLNIGPIHSLKVVFMKGKFLLLLVSGVPALCGAQTLAVQPVVTERPVVEAALVKPAENMSQMQPSSRFVQSRERAGKLKVLSSEVVADGVQKQVMQDERGVVYKRYLKDGQPLVSVNLARKLPQLKAEGSEVPTALWEDFEGYTGEGYDDWLPEGWTKKMAPGNEPVDSMVIDGVKRLINFNIWHTNKPLQYINGFSN